MVKKTWLLESDTLLRVIALFFYSCVSCRLLNLYILHWIKYNVMIILVMFLQGREVKRINWGNKHKTFSWLTSTFLQELLLQEVKNYSKGYIVFLVIISRAWFHNNPLQKFEASLPCSWLVNVSWWPTQWFLSPPRTLVFAFPQSASNVHCWQMAHS